MFFNKKNEEKQDTFLPAMLPPLEFSKDFEFLTFMVETEVAFEFYKYDKSNSFLYTDEESIKIINNISDKIVSGLSESYRMVLKKYLSENYIDEFIVRLITRKVIGICLDKNKKFFDAKGGITKLPTM